MTYGTSLFCIKHANGVLVVDIIEVVEPLKKQNKVSFNNAQFFVKFDGKIINFLLTEIRGKILFEILRQSHEIGILKLYFLSSE